MQNYNQQYYFNNQYQQQNIQSQLQKKKNDDNARKIFIAWLICLFTSFCLPFVAYITDGIFSVLDIELLSNIMTSIIAFISQLSSVLCITSHILIIVGKCKYPKNQSINIAFIVDMVILAISVFLSILFVIFTAIACGTFMASCQNCS